MELGTQDFVPPFQNLRVWKCAVELATVVYRVTQRFPNDERFGLTAQMRRASVSVAANLAEGRGRSGVRAYSAFVDIAVGSLREVEALASVANSLGFLGDHDFAAINEEVSKTAPLLVRLLTRLREIDRSGIRGR